MMDLERFINLLIGTVLASFAAYVVSDIVHSIWISMGGLGPSVDTVW
jgi:uncharacterized PurR-regulated membrane protein YhhQ (DUF165 family)